MHSFARALHRRTASRHETSPTEPRLTKGLVLDGGHGYDLTARFFDIFWFRGQWRDLRRRTIRLAAIQPGDAVLDVGCGTGTLALEVASGIDGVGRVVGIDPSPKQIARARAKAAPRTNPIDFQIGVIERLAFPDQTFDVALSTLMMHHLPMPLKRQGLAEIARVLKPGGRLVIADFARRQERQGQAARFHAGGSNLQDLATLIEDAGFVQIATEEMPPLRFSAFPGAGFVTARRR